MIAKRSIFSAVALCLLAAAPAAEAAECKNKAGEGTNSTEDGAKFQAWEAVLQAYDWGVWGQMMSTKQDVGVAPGVKVSNLKSRCNKGEGLGYKCVVQATLCR